jgi:hypothetical protein
MVAFKWLRSRRPLFVSASISLWLTVGLCITPVANALTPEYKQQDDASGFEAEMRQSSDLTLQAHPDQPHYNSDVTTSETPMMSCPSGDGRTCEDQVRAGHIGADWPLWTFLGLPIPYHSQSVRECAVQHDLCYFKQVPGAGADCDRALFDCLVASGNLPAQLVGLPYTVIMSVIFGGGVAQVCAYKNVERDCRCDFSPPQSEIERLAKNIWTTESMTLKHSECCNSSGECKPAGSSCTVELKTRQLGSLITSIDIFEGKCVQDSRSANH